MLLTNEYPFETVAWEGVLNAKEAPSTFRKYTERNLLRGLPEITNLPPHHERLYIACSGPSLLDTWEELKPHNGQIWALNSAFDWLCKRGVRPDVGVCLAPENAILDYFQEMQKDDVFLFACQTHPDLIDRAIDRGAQVVLWSTKHPEGWNMPVGKGPLVYGGGTVGSRSLDLAYVLGFRDVHILGMDACLSPDGRISVETPIYEDRRKDLRIFMINGRAFVALPSHARQVEDFAPILRPLQGMEVTLYGDGMLQWSQRGIDGSGTDSNSHQG